MNKKVDLMGLEVLVENINNNKLRDIIKSRLPQEKFNFYGDHTDRGKKNIYREHGDHGHNDHIDRHKDRGYNNHSDCDSGWGSHSDGISAGDHSDKHKDYGKKNHTDFIREY